MGSSLGIIPSHNKWAKYAADSEQQVPTVPMQIIMDSLPLPVKVLMTDMQGWDFTAISSLKPGSLARVELLESEIFGDHEEMYFMNDGKTLVRNALKDWKTLLQPGGVLADFTLENRHFGENVSYWPNVKFYNSAFQ